MKNNKHFMQVPYGIMTLGLSSDELGVYLALKQQESIFATEYDCFFMSNSDLMEVTKINSLHTLCKIKKVLKTKGAIIELPRVHVKFSPSEQSMIGYCAYFLPDLSATKEEQEEAYKKALKTYNELGIVSRKYQEDCKSNVSKYDTYLARCQNLSYSNMS